MTLRTLARLSLAGCALGLMVLVAGNALADREREQGRAHEHVDARHGHNHSYLDRGVVVREIPREAVPLRYGRDRYWFHGGIWYRGEGPRFVVVGPPLGIFVPVLPPFYVALTFGGVPYFYANDAYYVYRERERQYEVVAPPPGIEGAAGVQPPGGAPPGGPAAGGDDVFVYPKNGQTPEQQSRDRYECHRWAADQTGFDPTRGSGGVAPEQSAAKRSDYFRAINACLEARGYTVR
jgi:hypothetical protein